MKSAVLFLIAIAASAQMQDNREKKMTCEQNSHENRARHCNIVEQTLASTGQLSVDSGKNGGVTIKGWTSSETLVRTRIEAWAESASEASLIAGQVHTDTAGGQLRASGPESRNNSGWSVSYEVFVPQATNLKLNTHNGGIHISDVRGKMDFTTTNGGVHLSRIAGDVNGSTTNGGLHIQLVGTGSEGNQMNVRTQNGGVHLAVPSQYSARIQAETVNGGVHSDFPMPSQSPGERRPRNLDINLGSGGSLIHLSTTNGGVHVQRI
jgi:DUF4097 and DUF4098 domain-containing protein YvlB